MTLILLVEDDELVVEVVRDTLNECGYIVAAVGDGAPVRSIVELKQPDLVILDCGLPLVPGVEALRQIRTSTRCFAVPVLMLTARCGNADEEIALRAGANDYLRKPVDPDELVVRVEGLLSRHQRPIMPPPPAAIFGRAAPARVWSQR